MPQVITKGLNIAPLRRVKDEKLKISQQYQIYHTVNIIHYYNSCNMLFNVALRRGKYV